MLFTKKEYRLHNKTNILNREKYKIQDIIKSIDKNKNPDEYEKWNKIKKRKIMLSKHTKNILKGKLEIALKYNKSHHKKRLRMLNSGFLRDKLVVSMFESSLTRIIGIQTDKLTEELVIIKTFYFQILEDIMLHGFLWNGRKFRFVMASAGQTRKKMSVWIEESLYAKHENTFMCGLTVDEINRLGGVNPNKYNAYLALLNSSTDIWEGFDITKTIVVDDFETEVRGVVDFIDECTYTIERKEMDVPINQADGCGIFLPKLGKRTCIVRGPWLKGLLVPFSYDEFIKENKASSVVKDIWGKEYDIFKDDIQVIFTKSQFKMYQYYSSWQDYVDKFNEHNCEIGYCKEEEEKYIKSAVINYQELQTLNKMTDEETYKIVAKSNQRVQSISSDISTMLNAFGATERNRNKTPYQESLLAYPEMLTDIYSRITLREIKDSLVKSYWSGRLEVDGKYLFIVPDLYAFCENLFEGKASPDGLLDNGEIYTRIYPDEEEIDLLRSPHLFMEHNLRKQKKNEKTQKWFISNGIYISNKDLISKVLQCDWDGDTSLCVVDETIIECAKRHIKEYDVKPLYYNMSKASAHTLTNEVMYDGLVSSYTAPSIGEISNSICKIWNKSDFNEECLETIKLLCLKNNFSIDYAKTLFFPSAPDEIEKQIKQYTKEKLPKFFVHLKDKNKKEYQVEKNNGTPVNRLEKVIKNPRLKFPKNRLGKFDYRVLMTDPNIKIDEDLVSIYHNLNCKYHFKINNKDPADNNYAYVKREIMGGLSGFGYRDSQILDMLVKYLYEKKSRGKTALWFCYGDIIAQNIKANLNNLFMSCCECGNRFIAKSNYDKLCDGCKEKYSNVELLSCCDCGQSFAHQKNTTRKPERCPECSSLRYAYWNYKNNKKNKMD